MKLSAHELGERIAQLLSGAWRDETDLNLSADDLAAMLLRLCQTGAGALAWWRIRNTPLADSPAGQELKQVYRRFRLRALIHEQEIREVFACLRAANIEPVLVKGWAIARKYPDPGLRPYGDIDLCVRPDQFREAESALKCFASRDSHYVDLHAGFDYIGCGESASRRAAVSEARGSAAADFKSQSRKAPKSSTLRTSADSSASSAVKTAAKTFTAEERRGLAQRGAEKLSLPDGRATGAVASAVNKNWDEQFARSQLVPLGDVQVRILSDEDHLRVLSQHFFRSGAWRPLGLCDLAIASETRRTDFDWNICIGNDPVYANWVRCGVGLAQELLNARGRGKKGKGEGGKEAASVGNTFPLSPFPFSPAALPRWLAPAVLRQWGRARDANERATKVPAMLFSTRASGKVFQELYARWENPVRATARVGGRFNNWPRWPYQVAETFLRLPEWVK